MISNCCKAEFITELLFGDYHVTKCSVCLKQAEFAFVLENNYEANGVCQLYDDELYFYSQIISNLKDLKNLLSIGYTYVGQVKSVIDTIGIRYDTQDIDLVSKSKHISFSNEWKPKVMNPKFAMV